MNNKPPKNPPKDGDMGYSMPRAETTVGKEPKLKLQDSGLRLIEALNLGYHEGSAVQNVVKANLGEEELKAGTAAEYLQTAVWHLNRQIAVLLNE